MVTTMLDVLLSVSRQFVLVDCKAGIIGLPSIESIVNVFVGGSLFVVGPSST